MIVLILIAFLAFLGVLSSKNDSKYYIFVVVLSLATLYAFFQPTKGFDLYRHYEIFDYVKSINIKSLFNENGDYNISFSALLYNIYLDGSPAYILYVFLLSRIGGEWMLIFTTTALVYGIPMYICYTVGKKYDLSYLAINSSIIFLILSINYIDISGIRNILAVSFALLGVYWDLFLKKHRIPAFILYIVGILTHNSVIFIVLIRLVLLIRNKRWQRFAIFIVLAILPISITMYKSGIGFSSVPIIGEWLNLILKKLYGFVAGDSGSMTTGLISTTTFIFNMIARALGGISVAIICLASIRENKTIETYRFYVILVLAFFVSCIIQYDLFVRVNFFAVIMVAPLLPIAFSRIQVGRFTVLSGNFALPGICLYLFMMCDLVLYYFLSYRAFDGLFMW